MEKEIYDSVFGNDPINPASEIEYSNGGTQTINYLGLTKREYFAAMAMQGLLSTNRANHGAEDIAFVSVNLAEELIKALNKD